MICSFASRMVLTLLVGTVSTATFIGCGGSASDGTAVPVTQKGIDTKKTKIEEIHQKQIEAHKKAPRTGR